MVKLFTLVLLGGLATPVADAPPRIDVDTTCRATTQAIDGTGESYQACLRDENAARARILKAWSAAKPSTRQTCASDETRVRSYVELLTCMQMFEDASLLQ